MPPSVENMTTKFLHDGPAGYSSRSTVAQFIATLAGSKMLLSIGMMSAVSTVVIGASRKEGGELSMSDEEISWFGSLMMMVQPIASVLAGFLQNYIGRKRGMILMNIAALISWTLLYTATTTTTLYTAAIMMGVSAGLMDAPLLPYVGEITEPHLRGVMTSLVSMAMSVGLLFEFLASSIFAWRTAVAISAVIPVISMTMIAFIPDSPVWLLRKQRKEDALQALRWLRGWTSEENVKTEFNNLFLHTETSEPSATALKTTRNMIKDFFRGSILKPFSLVVCYQFFAHCAGLSGIRVYMIEVFNALEMPLAPEWIAFVTSGFMILGGLSCLLSVRYLGKRKLSLISMWWCAVGCILIGAYAYYENVIRLPWVPLVLICSSYFSMMLGIGTIPWMLMSEVFPLRGRALGAGLSAATFYIIGFLFSKTYLDLKHVVGLSGCFFLYGIGGVIGLVFLYACLPETEGMTLSEIEDYFSKKKQIDATHA